MNWPFHAHYILSVASDLLCTSGVATFIRLYKSFPSWPFLIHRSGVSQLYSRYKGDNKKTLFKDPTSPKDANGNAKEPNALKLGDADQATQPSAVENPRAVTGDTSASAPQPVSNGGNAGMGGGVSAIFPPSLHGKTMVGKEVHHDEAHHDRMDNPAPAGNNGNISNLVSNDNADMIDAAITIDQDYTPQNNGIEKLLGPQSNPMFPPSLEPKLPLPQHGAPAFGSSFGQGQHNLHHTGPSFGASGGGASNYATIDGPVTLPPPTTAYGTFGTNNHNSPVEVENSPGYGNMFSTATSGGLGAGLGGDGLGGGVNGYGGGNASGGLYPTLRFPALKCRRRNWLLSITHSIVRPLKSRRKETVMRTRNLRKLTWMRVLRRARNVARANQRGNQQLPPATISASAWLGVVVPIAAVRRAQELAADS